MDHNTRAESLELDTLDDIPTWNGSINPKYASQSKSTRYLIANGSKEKRHSFIRKIIEVLG